MSEEKIFKTYEKAWKYFMALPDKAKVLSVEFPKNSGEYKRLAFYKPDCTLQEQEEFDKNLEEEIKTNTSFFPKPKQEESITIEDLYREDEQKTRTVRISGKLHNGKLFWTLFFKNKGEFYPVVLTEDRQKIIVQEEEDESYFEYEGIRYRFEQKLFFKDTYRINTPSRKVLKKIDKIVNKIELFNRLKEKIKEYYDHNSPVEYNLIIPAFIVTYLHWGLGRTYYLILQGKEDTGKSTLQEFLAKIQMNGWFGGKSSVAVMVRLKHFFGISSNQDELEKMHKEEKTNFMGVANTGFNVNGTYNFVNMNKRKIEDQIQILNSFGFNSFSVNSLNLEWDFDKSFLSRCYPLISTRKNRKTKDIHNLNESEAEEFQELTDDLFCYCLTNYSEIEKNINEVAEELEAEGTFGRQTDLYSIILGILKHFNGDYIKEKKELKQKEGLAKIDESDTIEGTVFNYLVDLFIPKEEFIKITNKDICRFVNGVLELPEDKQLKPRTVGAILRRFGLITREDQANRKGKGYEYTIMFNQFLDMLQRYGYKRQLEKIKGQNYGSLSSRNSLSSEGNEDGEHNECDELTHPTSIDFSKSKIKETLENG